ncbi:MAG TPA: class I SAM-dependent methyltransferase [Thermoanaerobaculia bacterium]|nr:class I SAM-dependent methyltransferase [Thermoanaerobaculia bacterium]
MDGRQPEVWDLHWKELRKERSLFGTLASLVRRLVLGRAVRHYTGRYFPRQGWLADAGCGTGQASERIEPAERRLLGLDFSLEALLDARRASYRALVQCDIRHLPFRDGSLAGVWNLGVMEHFHPPEGHEILREVGRTLQPGGAALLFWPPEMGSSRMVLGPIEWVRTRLTGKQFEFFPAEVNRLRSFRHARDMLSGGGLEPAAVHFSLHDLFIHFVVVGRKPAA